MSDPLVCVFAPSVKQGVQVLRVCRVFRIIKIMKSFPGLQAFAASTLRASQALGSFLCLTAILMFVAALVGMQLFAGSMPHGRFHYDNLPVALLTTFQVPTRSPPNEYLVVVRLKVLESCSSHDLFCRAGEIGCSCSSPDEEWQRSLPTARKSALELPARAGFVRACNRPFGWPACCDAETG